SCATRSWARSAIEACASAPRSAARAAMASSRSDPSSKVAITASAVTGSPRRTGRVSMLPLARKPRFMSIYTSIWDSGILRAKVTLQLRLGAGESQLECNVWRLCERCFLFQGRLPGFDAFIGDALDTVLDRLDCEFV